HPHRLFRPRPEPPLIATWGRSAEDDGLLASPCRVVPSGCHTVESLVVNWRFREHPLRQPVVFVNTMTQIHGRDDPNLRESALDLREQIVALPPKSRPAYHPPVGCKLHRRVEPDGFGITVLRPRPHATKTPVDDPARPAPLPPQCRRALRER